MVVKEVSKAEKALVAVEAASVVELVVEVVS